MPTEYWLLGTLLAAVAIFVGFLAGRLTSPRERRCDELRKERDAAQQELTEVRGRVNEHFTQSARLFGDLATDYRALYQHFAHSARDLGLSDGERRELLEATNAAPTGDPSPSDEENALAGTAATPETSDEADSDEASRAPAAHQEPSDATGSAESDAAHEQESRRSETADDETPVEDTTREQTASADAGPEAESGESDAEKDTTTESRAGGGSASDGDGDEVEGHRRGDDNAESTEAGDSRSRETAKA